MNPLIEKFWEDTGYKIARWYSPIIENTWRDLFCLFKDDTFIRVVGVSKCFDGPRQNEAKCHVYYFNNKQYSENEMLKIIKMKAFI